jgi:Protein of unknown function (DUF4007)
MPGRAVGPPQETPQQEFSFSGHETFAFRYGWLTKAVNAASCDPAAFGSPDAVVALGVGKNMVRSMRHWALATQVSSGNHRRSAINRGMLRGQWFPKGL